ncbi:MAG: M28 family peptidase [Planctomycetota bacterium]
MQSLCLIAGLLCAPQAQEPAIDAAVARLVAQVDAARLRTTVEDLVGFTTRHVASATQAPTAGTGAARSYLEARFRELIEPSGGRLQVARHVYPVTSRRLEREVEIVNVIAVLPGTSDPERTYVIGGHYDSRNGDPRDGARAAPGANDDASGTAAVLEACRVLCAEPLAATVVFCCYDGEEMGLLGSTEHARDLANAEARVDGMITNDIVGNTMGIDGVRRDGYVRCFSYARIGADSSGRSLARAARWAARHVEGLDVMLVFRGDRYGRGGDHRPFFQNGYPGVRFTEPREDYSRQHQNLTERNGRRYGDLPDYMDFDYLKSVCALDVAILAELAWAPPPPASVRVRGARDAYDVAVAWQAPDIPDEASAATGALRYELLWRATTAADWEHRRVVEGAADAQRPGWLAAVLPEVCLDDVVVGVRTLGSNGARSRAVTPPEPDAFALRPR